MVRLACFCLSHSTSVCYVAYKHRSLANRCDSDGMCSTVCQRGTVGVEKWLQDAIDTQVSALLALIGKLQIQELTPSEESPRPAGAAGPLIQQLSYVLLYTLRLAHVRTVSMSVSATTGRHFLLCVRVYCRVAVQCRGSQSSSRSPYSPNSDPYLVL